MLTMRMTNQQQRQKQKIKNSDNNSMAHDKHKYEDWSDIKVDSEVTLMMTGTPEKM